MRNELVLWVDEEHVSNQQVVDVAGGQVKEEKSSAKKLCEGLGIHYRPMSQAIRDLVLYSKKKPNGQQTPVTLGSLGPFVLARVANGQVQNGFGVHDVPKPMKLSADTIRDLAGIFAGKD